MLLLLGALVVASLMLIPGQSIFANGVEALVVGLITCGMATRVGVSGLLGSAPERRLTFANSLVFFAIATLPYLVAAWLLLSDHASGYVWIAAAILLSIGKSVTDAWVLLVEINR